MSNMTPFEIRLELLKMARDMLYDSYNAERDRISQGWHMQCESARSKGETHLNIRHCQQSPQNKTLSARLTP